MNTSELKPFVIAAGALLGGYTETIKYAIAGAIAAYVANAIMQTFGLDKFIKEQLNKAKEYVKTRWKNR